MVRTRKTRTTKTSLVLRRRKRRPKAVRRNKLVWWRIAAVVFFCVLVLLAGFLAVYNILFATPHSHSVTMNMNNTVPGKVMTLSEAFPLIAEVSVMEDGRSLPHEFVLYSDGLRTAAVGNVSTYAGYRPARIIFDGNDTILYRLPDAAYNKPAALKYAGTTKMLYGILPPALVLENARFNETSRIYSGLIPFGNPNDTSEQLNASASYSYSLDYSFTILSWTPDGFPKEYEISNPLDAHYPHATVSFVKILKQGPIAAVDFDYSVFAIPEGTEYHSPDEFGVVIA